MEIIQNVLSDSEISKISSLYAYENDRFDHLYSLYLQKYMVHTYLHVDYANIIITKNEYGKPYFENTEGFEYNISHDAGCIVGICGFCKMGVDILHLDSEINVDIFTNIDKNIIDAICNDHNPQYKMVQLWTLIEAYFKAIGIGLRYDFDKLIIQNDCIQYLEYDILRYTHIEDLNYMICICF